MPAIPSLRLKPLIDNKPITISLFAGAYGLDLGLEKAGFQTVSLVEIEPDATKTISLNRPHLSPCAVPRDICQVNAETLLQEAGKLLGLDRPLRSNEVDLVTGGPPCQPFSTAGKRGSVGDPRGSLFMEFIRIVDEIKPRFFIMENVKGLLSAPIRHRPHDRRGLGCPPLESAEMSGAALQVILAEMKRIGYEVVYDLLNTADYGVPQCRERVIFIGYKSNDSVTFPLPTHSQKGTGKKPKWLTLREGLKDLVDPQPEFVPYSENRLKYLRLLTAGQNWRDLPSD